MASHHELGKKGEELAVSYLRQKQYEILHCNWTWGRREIDIIARHEGTIIFIEVKTRSSQHYGMPEEAVHHRKTEHLLLAADRYLEQYGLQPDAIRFDIISITATAAGLQEILHLEDAF